MNKLKVLVIITLATLGSVTYGQPGECKTLTLDRNTKGPSSFYHSGKWCQRWIIKPRNYSMINMDVSWRDSGRSGSCSSNPPLYIHAGDSQNFPRLGNNVRCGVQFEKSLISNGSILVDFKGRPKDESSYSFTIIWSTTLTTEPVQPPQPACGSGPAPRSSKIIGGAEAADYWPPMVALHFFGDVRCGGVFINDQWVLTAAHCTENVPVDNYKVIYGTRNVFAGSEKRVSQVIVHEEYVPGSDNNPNDIALLRLDSPVMLGGIVGTACLPSADVSAGDNVTVIGYGLTSYPDGFTSDQLYEVIVSVTDFSTCAASYADHIENILLNSDQHLCAGLPGKDSCSGDSGGPLFYNRNGAWEVQGIVSFGIGCAHPDYPGVYTNVINYVDWIRTNCNNCV